MRSLADITQQGIQLALYVSAPVLLAGIAVSILVSTTSTFTRWTDPSLAHLARLVAVVLVVLVAGAWAARHIVQFTAELWRSMPSLAGIVL